MQLTRHLLPLCALALLGGAAAAQDKPACAEGTYLFEHRLLVAPDNAVFQRFMAERPGQVHFLKGEYWFRAGAISAHRILDDLWQDVLDEDAGTASPNPWSSAYR